MVDRPVFKYHNKDGFQAKYNWWGPRIEDKERYAHIFQIVKGILQKQASRSEANLFYAQLYQNCQMMGLDPGMFSKIASTRGRGITQRVTLNVVKSCIDTVSSKIAKSKPRPMFLTEDGSFQVATKAKNLTKYMDGWFDSTQTYQKGRSVFVDGCAFGTGALKIYAENGQVKSEKVFINEIIVDEAEGIYGEPRQMHQKKAVFREVLAESFPEHREKIFSATSSLREDYREEFYADMVYVIESWHLPSGAGAEDGRHTISIDNCTLFDEQYDKDYFPFSFFRWSNSLLGFYGTGLAEELVGIQLEINKILRNIQIAQSLMAVPQIWLEGNSQVVPSHVNNEIGGIKRYVGTPPIFQVPQAMSPEIYNHLENLFRKAFQITGTSESSATSKKPAGVTAGIALQTLSDLETERFMVTAQRFEEFYLDVARKVIDMTRDVYAEDKSIKVKAPGGAFMESIAWKDVDLEEDKYILRCYPTNLLPTQPAGRLQKIQELLQAGFFDKEDAIALLDYPDLKAVTERITAPRDDVLKLIGLMLSKGVYFSPEPYMNLELAKRLTQSEYLKAKVQNAPDDRLDLLRRFMDDCDDYLNQAQEALMIQQAEMQANSVAPAAAPLVAAEEVLMDVPMGDIPLDPMASPEAPPVSELLPV